MLEVRTLGGFSLGKNGRPIQEMGSRKAEALLVYIAVEAGYHNRNVLASLLWPESSQAQAATSLRVALTILRRHLGDYLDISRETVRIKPEAQIYFDLADLQEKLACGQIEQAMKIYHGDFLQGFHLRDAPDFEEWVRWESDRARSPFLKALHSAADAAMADGEYSRGMVFLHRLHELDPLDESAHEKSMLLLALDGQRGAALAQYERCCAVLQAELDILPSEEIQRLHQKILRGEKLTAPTPAVRWHNLPAAQTSFIGRKAELQQIEATIHDPACRLISLVGPGGCGKTRLALQAAGKVMRSFADGACFVSLEACASIRYLVSTIAQALRFDIDGYASDFDPKTQLLDYLRNRSILLIMDGFEHLVEGAGLLSEILEAAPKVKLIVTSRQRLGLHGEWVLQVEGLPVHLAGDYAEHRSPDAVHLFCIRARQANADFQLVETQQEPVTRICQLVEGMPLGIELAAAWHPMLTPAEIAGEMEKGLDFLITSMRDVPEKHRSLRAVFDSTWALLSPGQQTLFSQLAIFRGGFSRQAAEQVCGASLAQLSALRDKSLLWKTAAGSYDMHNLLRQFALEKLAQTGEEERDALYARFSQHYIDRLLEREMGFWGTRMLQVRDDIRAEMENLRTAVDWACLHWEATRFRKALIALMFFYVCHGWHEGKDAFRDIARLRSEELLACGVSDPNNDPVVLSARIHQALFQTELGQIEESEAISRECLNGLIEFGMKEELCECMNNLGVNASFRGEYEESCDWLEKAVLLGKECDYLVWYTCLLWLGHTYFLLGEYEQGVLTLQKSIELFERLGTHWGIAFGLSKMGLALDGMGEHARALQAHRDALAIFNRINNAAGQGFALSRMCMSAALLGEYQLAVEYGLQACQFCEKIGHQWVICSTRCRLIFAYIGLRDIEKAKQYVASALEQSGREQMLPLILYALGGAASIFAVQNDGQAALELFNYVQQHPQTPGAFLMQAERWMEGLDEELLQRGNATRLEKMELEEIIEWVMKRFAIRE